MSQEEKPKFEVDQVTLTCNGCGRERVLHPDRTLESARELINWLNTVPGRCVCNHDKYDVKARMKDQPK